MLTTVKKTVEVDVYSPSDEEVQAAIEIIEAANPCRIYWDQRDSLSNSMIQNYWKCRNDPHNTPMSWLETELYERNDH